MLGKLNFYVTRVSVFLIPVALIVGRAGCDIYNPPPSQDLEIRTWYDLDAVRDSLRGHYILMNDLDSTSPGYEELASRTANGGKGWQPIGHGCWVWTWFGVKAAGEIFKGILDGQGYEIRDLYINNQEEDQVGLLGFVVEGAIIKNITFINATVTTGEASGHPVGLGQDTVRCLDVAPVWGVGGLVGYNGGTVSNCHGTGNISSDSGVGALVGYNYGTVSNSYCTGSVAGNESVGGLVGSNWATVRRSFWDIETSGQATSGGGTGKTTAQMKNIATFSEAGWNIVAVANPGTRKPFYIWNIVDGETYPFLSWQPVS